VNDTSALSALYSALIQANATILAILGGFLFAFPRRNGQPDKTPPAESQPIAAPTANLRHYSAATLALLFLGCFGIFVPSVLLALLPSDPAPFLRSYFALAAYGCSLFGIVILLMTMAPEHTGRADELYDLNLTISVWLTVLILSFIGILFAHLIPLPIATDRGVLPTAFATPPTT